jgi:hypothetical protein
MAGVPSKRSTFKTHPSMGLPPTWNVGDLPMQFSTPTVILNQVSSNTSSAAFNPQANSIEIWANFADGFTVCDLVVSNLINGVMTQVAEFDGVSLFNCSNLYVGELDQGITLQGQPIQITAQNFRTTNAGTPGPVTVGVSRIN